MSDDFDYSKLDPLIVDEVRLIRKTGFDTIGSCQGGKDHAMIWPTVLMIPDPEPTGRSISLLRHDLAKVLILAGYHGFALIERWNYQKDRIPWTGDMDKGRGSLIVEFWGGGPKGSTAQKAVENFQKETSPKKEGEE